ncbi:hypothetical protein GQ53DRAFT_723800 [Thozetella sp. PMI_491]|nr:hypothetical protein GQ53DRAFT_723800 [Thozetella sp. PMI_491]
MAAKPWADGPLAMIPSPVFLTKKHDMWTSGASHMCIVHNAIFRGYNTIYHQASHVADADKTDFIGYCLVWHKFVRTHAENEEASLFPRAEGILDDDTIFKHAHEEHNAFMPGITQFYDYLQSLKTPKDFSAAKLITIMEAFQDAFEAHFKAEVLLIAGLADHPNALKVGSPEELKSGRDFDAKEGMALLGSGPTDVIPFFLFNIDRAYEGGLWKDWPPIPAPVRWTLVGTARVLHSGWWKFASCNPDGYRKDLYATVNDS